MVGKHIEGKANIFFDRHGIEQSGRLKQHAYFHSDLSLLFFVEAEKIGISIKYIALGGGKESYQEFEQDRFTGSATTDNEIGLPREKFGGNIVEDGFVAKRLENMCCSNHVGMGVSALDYCVKNTARI